MKICGRKTCKHKKEPQPESNFNKRFRTKDGLANECKDCSLVDSRRVNAREKENRKNMYSMFIG